MTKSVGGVICAGLITGGKRYGFKCCKYVKLWPISPDKRELPNWYFGRLSFIKGLLPRDKIIIINEP